MRIQLADRNRRDSLALTLPQVIQPEIETGNGTGLPGVKPQDYILVECPLSASWNIDRSSFGAPAQFRWGGDTSVKVVFHPFATVPVRSYMMISFGRAG